MFDAQDEIGRGVTSVTLPFITLHGTGDTLVNIESSQFLYDNARSEDKTFKVRSCVDCTIRVQIHSLLVVDYTIVD